LQTAFEKATDPKRIDQLASRVRYLQKEFVTTTSQLGEIKDLEKPGVFGKIMSKIGFGKGGMLGGLGGILSKVPGLGMLLTVAGMGAAIGNEVMESIRQRTALAGAGVNIQTLMGRRFAGAMRGGMISRGAGMGFVPQESLEQTQLLTTAVSERQMNGDILRRAQGLQRGFGIDVSQTANFLELMRRSTGKSDVGRLETIIEKGMKNGITKADLPKYLSIIADATEKSLESGAMNADHLRDILMKMASTDKVFRQNPMMMQAVLRGAEGLFGAKEGFRGTFARAAILGARPGASLADIIYEQQLVREGGITSEGIRGPGGKVPVSLRGMMGGTQRLEALKKQFDIMGIKDPKSRAIMGGMMLDTSMEVAHKFFERLKTGGTLTPEERAKFEREVKEGRTLTNLTGKDFRLIILEAQKQALRAEIGDKLLPLVFGISTTLNTIRGYVARLIPGGGGDIAGIEAGQIGKPGEIGVRQARGLSRTLLMQTMGSAELEQTQKSLETKLEEVKGTKSKIEYMMTGAGVGMYGGRSYMAPGEGTMKLKSLEQQEESLLKTKEMIDINKSIAESLEDGLTEDESKNLMNMFDTFTKKRGEKSAENLLESLQTQGLVTSDAKFINLLEQMKDHLKEINGKTHPPKQKTDNISHPREERN
jgi:hypothetical protein